MSGTVSGIKYFCFGLLSLCFLSLIAHELRGAWRNRSRVVDELHIFEQSPKVEEVEVSVSPAEWRYCADGHWYHTSALYCPQDFGLLIPATPQHLARIDEILAHPLVRLRFVNMRVRRAFVRHMMYLEYRDKRKWSLIGALDDYRSGRFVEAREDGA